MHLPYEVFTLTYYPCIGWEHGLAGHSSSAPWSIEHLGGTCKIHLAKRDAATSSTHSDVSGGNNGMVPVRTGLSWATLGKIDIFLAAIVATVLLFGKNPERVENSTSLFGGVGIGKSCEAGHFFTHSTRWRRCVGMFLIAHF